MKMQGKWFETEATIKTINWEGEPLILMDVKVLKNSETGKILIHPSEVAQAEIRQIARKFGLEPRDVATLLILKAKPGPFKEGEVLFKYHLQKMLFYFWKNLNKQGCERTLPLDMFKPAINGPMPENLDNDLKRFEEKNIVNIKLETNWINKTSKRVCLTNEGKAMADQIWDLVPNPYKEIAINTKEAIYPLDPDTIRHKVHVEYPEYRDTYVENDIE